MGGWKGEKEGNLLSVCCMFTVLLLVCQGATAMYTVATLDGRDKEPNR